MVIQRFKDYLGILLFNNIYFWIRDCAQYLFIINFVFLSWKSEPLTQVNRFTR